MADQRRTKPNPGIPLWLALSVPLALYAVLAGGVVGLLSFLNGQKAVDGVTSQLRNQIGTHIEEHLRGFLRTPNQINQVNEAAIREGRLDLHDPEAMAGHFRNQVQAFAAVSSIYFGNAAGGLINSGREGAGGELYVIATEGLAQGTFRKYATDDEGNRTRLVATLPDFDARTRPWYRHAVASDGVAWSEPYVLFTGQDMALAASRPVYDSRQRLLGVVSVDVFLSQLSEFLGRLKIGKTGHSFVIDRAGLLIASSTGEKLFREADNGGGARRISARESAVPAVRDAMEALLGRFQTCQAIRGAEQLSGEIAGERQFVQILPVGSEEGIDWLVVTTVPEADFMARIRAGNRTTGFLVLATLALAGLMGVLAARWLARPILGLEAAVQAMARGEWPDAKIQAHGIAEIRDLELSFGRMARELQVTMQTLTAEVAERKRAMASLQESEQRLGLALQGAELGTWDWSVQSDDVVFNERWATMLGYSLDEIRPEVRAWKELLHPDDTEAVMKALADHIEGRIPIYQVEHRLRAKSGEWRWVLAAGKVIAWDEEGRPLRAAGIHQDITPRKRLAERLVRQERQAAVGQLAAGIAHDFNNILAAIMGFAELLRTEPGLSATMAADLDEIRAAGRRGARLVNQILDFSQKSLRQPQRIDLDAFLLQCVADLEPLLPTTIRLHLERHAHDALVEVDPSHMQELVMNLVANARDAMPAGGVVRIRLSRVAATGGGHCAICSRTIAGEWLRLDVADTGTGIPAEILPRVFEPFFTTKEVGKGTGLGLAQVAGILEQSGGHVKVESKAGEGTMVTCYLPPLNTDAECPAPVENCAAKGAREQVLVVGGAPAETNAVVGMLARLGYASLAAPSGTEALRLLALHGQRIGAVVLADSVPDMDSRDLLVQLQEIHMGLRTVVVGEAPLAEERSNLSEMGAVSWVRKPLAADTFVQVLSAVCPADKGRWD